MINAIVEGESDVELIRAVIREAGHDVGTVRVARGKPQLDIRLASLSEASRQTPWIALRDSDSKCPVELRASLAQRIPHWHANFRLRIAHSMAEAWLLADAEAFSSYFGVSQGRVPTDPESLANAKQTLLALCANSRRRDIVKDVVRPSGQTGPLYVSRINEFARDHWRPGVAADASESLRRAIDSLRSITTT